MMRKGVALIFGMLVLGVAGYLAMAQRGGRPPARESAPTAEAPAPAAVPVPLTPPPAPPPPAPRVARPAPAKDASGPMSEAGLMARLREAAGTNPKLVVELARTGNKRFPESADAPERTALLIHALADLDQRIEARGEAEQMVNHYPDSKWVRDVEAFTGAHRHRNMRVNDAGQLEYYEKHE